MTIGDHRTTTITRTQRALRRTPAVAAVALATSLILAGPAGAAPDPERYDTTPTGWAWYANTTEAKLNTYNKTHGMRLFDIEVTKPAKSRFASAMVHNSGIYHRGSWHWYFGLTFKQVTTLPELTSGRERVVDVESYLRKGKRRYAVVTVDNHGDSAKAWKWYLNVTKKFIKNNRAGYRIIDLDPRVKSSRYDVVMIRNKGEDKRAWWYYYKRTPAQIKKLLKQNKARLVDIEPDGKGTFTVVMVRREGEYWWWYYGQTAAQLKEKAAQNGARIIDIERYRTPSGKWRYAAIMLNDLNKLSTKVRQLMKPAMQDAAFGFYLKRVDGPVYAGLQTEKAFEPASTIKALHHLHALRAIKLGQATLTEPITWYVRPSDPARYPGDADYSDDKNKCAYDSDGNAILDNPYTDQLGEVILQQMMERSDNRTTDAVVNRFGMAALNNTAANVVGMEKSKLFHRIGCPHNASPQPYQSNRLTLRDAGRLYEGVADGTLLGNATWRELFYDYMLNGTGGWKSVVDQEAAKLGKPQATADDFLAAIRTAVKGGSYTNTATCPSGTSGVCRLLRRTGFGVLYLPFKNASGRIVQTPYVYGSFVDGTFACGPSKVVGGKQTACDDEVDAIGAARSKAHREMLRPRIRQALMTW